MSRHLITSVLHWTAALSLLFLLSVDDRINGAPGWVLVVSGGAMVTIWLSLGLQHGPGPALSGPLRAAHPWLSRVIYVLLGWSAVSLALASLGPVSSGWHPRAVLLALCGAALGRGIFHFWRHAALCDGALRRITLRPLHTYL